MDQLEDKVDQMKENQDQLEDKVDQMKINLDLKLDEIKVEIKDQIRDLF